MIIIASWLAWPGYEAFLVTQKTGPCILIQIERIQLQEKLAKGESLERIVTNG